MKISIAAASTAGAAMACRGNRCKPTRSALGLGTAAARWAPSIAGVGVRTRTAIAVAARLAAELTLRRTLLLDRRRLGAFGLGNFQQTGQLFSVHALEHAKIRQGQRRALIVVQQTRAVVALLLQQLRLFLLGVHSVLLQALAAHQLFASGTQVLFSQFPCGLAVEI